MPKHFDLSIFTSLTSCEYHYLPAILSSELCTQALCVVLCCVHLIYFVCMVIFFIWNIKVIK